MSSCSGSGDVCLTLTLTSDPTVNVCVDHTSRTEQHVLDSLPPTGISDEACVRRRVNVKSKSAVFITVLRVLTGIYLSYQS